MANVKTYEQILSDMLARVPNDLDKREGSVIYDALAPAAAELAQEYIEIQAQEDLAFIDTSNGERLRQKGSEVLGDQGLPATFAVRKGEFKDTLGVLFDVPLNSRYRLNNVVYEVTSAISTGIFELTAETAGTVGNIDFGFMVPVTNVPNLGTAELQDVLILGENAETDAEYVARYKKAVSDPAQDGNIAQYEEWANEFGGIGRAKVFPLWNGQNTVKVSILDDNNDIASGTLVDDFQEYLMPLASPGLGEGQAPIGAIVTVTTAAYLTINVTATITLTSGFTIPQAETEVAALLETFFRDQVSYLKDQVTVIETGNVILSAQSVQSVAAGLLLNGSNSDVPLGAEQIPEVGTVSLSE